MMGDLTIGAEDDDLMESRLFDLDLADQGAPDELWMARELSRLLAAKENARKDSGDRRRKGDVAA